MDGGDLVTVELSADLFKCPVCSKPYQPPIYQCNSGHFICSSCRKKSGKDCRTCEKSTVFKHNKLLETIVTRAKFHCVNHVFGCSKLSSCHDKATHEKNCLYMPILCSESDCDFSGSKDMLSGHLAVVHEHSIQKFCYDQSFRVFLSVSSNKEVLLAEDGTLFLLQNSEEVCGFVLSVVCVRPLGLIEPNFSCNLKLKKNTGGDPEHSLALCCPVPSTASEDGMKYGEFFSFCTD